MKRILKENDFVPYAEMILNELNTTLHSIGHEESNAFQEEILKANEIYLAGAGRSGLMMKCFAMRLMHLGLKAFVVGETTTPNIGNGDCLIIGSGSGETESLVVMAKKAKKLGAKLLLITIDDQSSIAKLADVVIVIAAPSPKTKKENNVSSIQPMGSLFEQSLLLSLDTVILGLMSKMKKNSDNMFSRHANLE